MKMIKISSVSTVLLLLGACATPMNTATREKAIEKAVKESIATPTDWAALAAKNVELKTTWLAAFNDPKMLELIAEGKKNNINLQVAAGNMDRAWLLAEKSGSALKPSADLSIGRAQTGSANGGGSSSQVTVGLKVSWEADVWGRLQAGVSGAQASAQAAEADYIYAQHSLSANIAKTYFKVIEAKLQADITRTNLDLLEQGRRITQVKFDNGMSSAQDIALNRAEVASAKEQLITIDGAQREAIRALEVLLGRYPSATLDIAKKLPKLPAPPPAGIPSEILERRPDLISAERSIAAAFNATDQAKAARLPKFSLTSTLSGSSSSLANVLSPSNVAWQLAGNLLAPLFDGGRGKIDVEIATVEQKSAVANYAQKALTAFAEVENNLDQGRVLAAREEALTEVQQQSNKAYRVAAILYKEGESGLLDTLQIQQQAIAAKSNLLAIQRSQLEQRINLYMALGGDWQSN